MPRPSTGPATPRSFLDASDAARLPSLDFEDDICPPPARSCVGPVRALRSHDRTARSLPRRASGAHVLVTAGDQPCWPVLLASGLGTRMRSRTPKVLHPLLGRPMLAYIVDAA